MGKQVEEQDAKIRKLAKEGSKSRAIIALKHKKFMIKEQDKVAGAELLLTQTAQGIEAAKADLNVFEAMKQGDKVLKELRQQVSVEQWEDLYDDHLDQVA